jgi:hypothetical protein
VRHRLSFDVDAPADMKLTWLIHALEKACLNEGARLVPPVRFGRHLELVKTDDEGDDAA